MKSEPVSNSRVVRVRFRRIKIDRHGYEMLVDGLRGQYWGIGLPIYRFYRVDPKDGEETYLTDLRASDRRVAKDKFLAYAQGRGMANVEFVR